MCVWGLEKGVLYERINIRREGSLGANGIAITNTIYNNIKRHKTLMDKFNKAYLKSPH